MVKEKMAYYIFIMSSFEVHLQTKLVVEKAYGISQDLFISLSLLQIFLVIYCSSYQLFSIQNLPVGRILHDLRDVLTLTLYPIYMTNVHCHHDQKNKKNEGKSSNSKGLSVFESK